MKNYKEIIHLLDMIEFDAKRLRQLIEDEPKS